MSYKNSTSGTYLDNMKLPVHRWFKYSAGFSAKWVEDEVRKFEAKYDKKAVILDPFVGSGTTTLTCCTLDNKAYGYDGHPLVARVAKAKHLWHLDRFEFKKKSLDLYNLSREIDVDPSRYYEVNLLEKCYDIENFKDLEALRLAYIALADENPIYELIWLNITSILRPCSNVGTAQWQYILPNKTKAKVLSVEQAFLGKVELMFGDMEYAEANKWEPSAIVKEHDVREPFSLSSPANFVITSPPYANNYDYADATRLEMTYWGDINSWGDLKTAVRPTIMRSCSQHSAGDKVDANLLLDSEELFSVRDTLRPIVEELAEVRLTKGGKKTYHTMVAAYFYDLALIVKNLKANLEKDSEMCWVIGDSAPYGVYIPVDTIISEIAINAGFESTSFEKIRDRNIKWKNRTHTVLLKEGRLRIKG